MRVLSSVHLVQGVFLLLVVHHSVAPKTPPHTNSKSITPKQVFDCKGVKGADIASAADVESLLV